jgi:hypothetical protein
MVSGNGQSHSTHCKSSKKPSVALQQRRPMRGLGWSERACGRGLHPLKSSGFHRALLRQTMPIILTGVVRNPTKKK